VKIKIIRQTLNITNVAKFYGLNKVKGKYRCPLHKDQHPSMQIYENNQVFVCFTCGTKGDVVNLVQAIFSINCDDAVRKIDSDFSLGLYDQEINYKAIQEHNNKVEEQRKKRENFKLVTELALLEFKKLQLTNTISALLKRNEIECFLWNRGTYNGC
jgi:DNA primase